MPPENKVAEDEALYSSRERKLSEGPRVPILSRETGDTLNSLGTRRDQHKSSNVETSTPLKVGALCMDVNTQLYWYIKAGTTKEVKIRSGSGTGAVVPTTMRDNIGPNSHSPSRYDTLGREERR